LRERLEISRKRHFVGTNEAKVIEGQPRKRLSVATNKAKVTEDQPQKRLFVGTNKAKVTEGKPRIHPERLAMLENKRTPDEEETESMESDQQISGVDESPSGHKGVVTKEKQSEPIKEKKSPQFDRTLEKSSKASSTKSKEKMPPRSTPIKVKKCQRSMTPPDKEQHPTEKDSPVSSPTTDRKHAEKKSSPKLQAEKDNDYEDDERSNSSSEERSFIPPEDFKRPSHLMTSASPQPRKRKRRTSPKTRVIDDSPKKRRLKRHSRSLPREENVSKSLSRSPSRLPIVPKTRSCSPSKKSREYESRSRSRSKPTRPLKRRSGSPPRQHKQPQKQSRSRSMQKRPLKRRSRSWSSKGTRSKERSKKPKYSRNKVKLEPTSDKETKRDLNSEGSDPYNLEIVCFQSDKEEERVDSPSSYSSNIDFFDMVSKVQSRPKKPKRTRPRPEMMEYHQNQRARRRRTMPNRLPQKRPRMNYPGYVDISRPEAKRQRVFERKERSRQEHYPMRHKARKKHWPMRPDEHSHRNFERPNFRARKVFKHNVGEPYPKGVSRLERNITLLEEKRRGRAVHYPQPRSWRRR